MSSVVTPGQVVILNGPPRSGKSTIASTVQETFSERGSTSASMSLA